MNNEVGTKSLHSIAFLLLLIGGLAALAYFLYDALLIMFIWTGITNFYSGVFAFVGSIADLKGADTIAKIALYGMGGLIMLAFLIFILIYVVFIVKLLKNKAKPTKQNYLKGVFIISIINLIFAVSGLVGGSYVSLIGLAIHGTIVAGYFIQSTYKPSDEVK